MDSRLQSASAALSEKCGAGVMGRGQNRNLRGKQRTGKVMSWVCIMGQYNGVMITNFGMRGISGVGRRVVGCGCRIKGVQGTGWHKERAWKGIEGLGGGMEGFPGKYIAH